MNRNALEVLSNLLLSFPEEAFTNLSLNCESDFTSKYTPKQLFELQTLDVQIDPVGVFAFHFEFTGSWSELDDYLFGKDGDDAFWFIMSGTFEHNTALDVSRRISYMLEHGVPTNCDETFVVAE